MLRKALSILAIVLALGLSACAPQVGMNYKNTALLKHTYSLFIRPSKDKLSQEFARYFKETLLWEQYLYLPEDESDADSTVDLKVERTTKGFKVLLHFMEKDTNGDYRVTVYLYTKPSLKDPVKAAAKFLAYHLQEFCEFPPEINAATLYYNLTDPSGDAER